jgi:hypothetical protein
MPETPPETLDATLRRAGFDLPKEAVADLARGHELLVAMLARLGSTAAEAEPATTFRPDAAR